MRCNSYLTIVLTLPVLLLGCGDDTSSGTSLVGLTSESGGDGDGDTNETGTNTQGDGDGDGDPTGDGDGDGEPGDGDPTGDGDGDPTGDGDGDPTGDGDGDGDPTGDGDGDGDADTDVQFCMPGEQLCTDIDSYQICANDGTQYGPEQDCDPLSECLGGTCIPSCVLVQSFPSSVGCSFLATKHDNFYSNQNDASQNDSLIAGNISSSKSVNAQLYFVPLNSNVEQPQGGVVQIPPEGTYTWSLSQVEIDSITTTRQGGVYRLETDLPIVAYQHSPIGATATNDASMLLPEYALTGNYVVSSYQATVGAYPSYMLAIGVVDNTVVDILVNGATSGGGGIPALADGQSTQVNLDRFEILNLVVAQQNGGDLSGTIVTANQPLHLIGATECANIPSGQYTFCDHLEEAMFPLEYWGEEYVGAHAPTRGNEQYHWRVYGGDNNVTVTTAPVQPGFPINLDKGEFYQFAATQSFVFTGNGPFLPVQYLESENPNAGTGDPAMYQMVPTEQFLDRYAFVTGTGYNPNYAQIIRPAGGADVILDGNLVGGYYNVGNYQVSDVVVGQGAHFVTSDQPFGVIQVGYTGVTSYAYPGGLKLEVINPQ